MRFSPRDTDLIVLDVWLGIDELDRYEFRRVGQGTLRWDACLDGRGLEDAWCGGVLQDGRCDGLEAEDAVMEKLRKH